MKNIKIIYILFIFLIFSCKEDVLKELNFPDYTLSEYLYQVMIKEHWYYWADSANIVNPGDFPDSLVNEYLDKIIYKEKDRFSYLDNIKEHDDFIEKGEDVIYGFRYKFDEYLNMRISLVIKNSPFDREGIKRGYILKEINDKNVKNLTYREWTDELGPNKAGHSAKFKLVDYDNNEIIAQIAKETVQENAIQFSAIYNRDNKKIGYFVFNSFIQPAFDELDNLFSEFKNQNVGKIIVDLRYNNGGLVSVSWYLGSLLAGIKADGEIFKVYEYNSYKSENNEAIFFQTVENSIITDSIVFITSRQSASSSEVLINSLKPFLHVTLIGDTTYGKPFGMKTFRYKNMVASFITYRSLNANGDGNYYNGIPVDITTRDGLDKDFGDTNEACLKQALHYIETGGFYPSLKTIYVSNKQNLNYFDFINLSKVY